MKGLSPPAPLALTPTKTQEVIEISGVVKVPDLAEIAKVDELAPVLEVVKEGVEEVSSEKSSCLNFDADVTFAPKQGYEQ